MFKLEAPDDLSLVRHALLIPPPAEGRGPQQTSGVLTAEGGGMVVENAISWSTSFEPVNATPNMPAPDEIVPLAGSWMFGRVLYGHLGHFITESFARAWALDEIRGKIEGILFTPKQTSGNIGNMLKVLRPLMDLLGLDVPVRCITTPTRVDQLYVPRQGVGMNDLTTGSRKFRDFVNAHSGATVAAEGDARIYISCSLHPPGRGGLIGESLLEPVNEGYQLFHPQKHHAAVQIARYKAARDIITVYCSPLHMVAYVGNSAQRVGILTRRNMDFAPSFIRQLEAFKGITAFEVNTLVRDWIPGRSLRPGRGSFGEIDFPRPWQILRERGMISSDTSWPALIDEQREADLTHLNALHDLTFYSLDENLALQEKKTAAKAV